MSTEPKKRRTAAPKRRGRRPASPRPPAPERVRLEHTHVYGMRLAYRTAGAGPPVVLIHGLAASSLTWSANLRALAQRHTVYALDLPGHGDSDKLVIDYQIDTGVRVIHRFMERMGVERAALVGNSIGGLLALRFARTYPDQVTHLVLVDSAGLGRSMAWFLRITALPGLGEALHSMGGMVSARSLAKRLFAAPERIERRLLERLHKARTAQAARDALVKVARVGAGLRGLKDRAYDLPYLGDVAAPVLVVWGEHDKVFSADHAREVAERYPDIPVEIFPNAGHWPHMEEADAFNDLVLRFLETGQTHSSS